MIVKLPAFFTSAEIPALLPSLQSALSVDSPCLVLDLSEVQDMDTAAMDVLLNCVNQLINRDGVLKVAALSPQAATFLELTGMNRVLDDMPEEFVTVPSVAEAPQIQAVPVAAVAVAEEPTLQTSVA